MLLVIIRKLNKLNKQAKQGSNSGVSAMVASYHLCIQGQKMEIVGSSPSVTEQQLTTAASAYSVLGPLKSSFPLIRNLLEPKIYPRTKFRSWFQQGVV